MTAVFAVPSPIHQSTGESRLVRHRGTRISDQAHYPRWIVKSVFHRRPPFDQAALRAACRRGRVRRERDGWGVLGVEGRWLRGSSRSPATVPAVSAPMPRRARSSCPSCHRMGGTSAASSRALPRGRTEARRPRRDLQGVVGCRCGGATQARRKACSPRAADSASYALLDEGLLRSHAFLNNMWPSVPNCSRSSSPRFSDQYRS